MDSSVSDWFERRKYEIHHLDVAHNRGTGTYFCERGIKLAGINFRETAAFAPSVLMNGRPGSRLGAVDAFKSWGDHWFWLCDWSIGIPIRREKYDFGGLRIASSSFGFILSMERRVHWESREKQLTSTTITTRNTYHFQIDGSWSPAYGGSVLVLSSWGY